MHEVDAAYIAGLFDGEGSIYYKQTRRKRHDRPGKPIHNTWVIRMEIAMTDKSVLYWLHEVLGCGTVGPEKLNQATSLNGVGDVVIVMHCMCVKLYGRLHM